VGALAHVGEPALAEVLRILPPNAAELWLWAWANPHLEPEIWRSIVEVRQFGEAHTIEQLTTPKWQADSVDGWEMTSVSAYILQAKGVYRTPREDGGFTYMIFTAIGWGDISASPEFAV
jgi:hypothetical protein